MTFTSYARRCHCETRDFDFDDDRRDQIFLSFFLDLRLFSFLCVVSFSHPARTPGLKRISFESSTGQTRHASSLYADATSASCTDSVKTRLPGIIRHVYNTTYRKAKHYRQLTRRCRILQTCHFGRSLLQCVVLVCAVYPTTKTQLPQLDPPVICFTWFRMHNSFIMCCAGVLSYAGDLVTSKVLFVLDTGFDNSPALQDHSLQCENATVSVVHSALSMIMESMISFFELSFHTAPVCLISVLARKESFLILCYRYLVLGLNPLSDIRGVCA